MTETRYLGGEKARGGLRSTEQLDDDPTFEEDESLFDATQRSGQKASLFLARACEIACAAFERAIPTIYIGKGKSSSMSRVVPGSPTAPDEVMLRGVEEHAAVG